MHRLTAFFLYLFLLDGLVATTDALGRLNNHTAQIGVVGILSGCLSVLVFLLGLALFAGTVVTPWLSKRLIFPPVLFMGFCIVWDVLYGQRAGIILFTAEIWLAVGLIVGCLRKKGMQNLTESRPFFTWKNFLCTGVFNSSVCLFIAFFIALSLTQKVRSSIETSTGHFLAIRPAGISLQERRFQKDGKEIRLIGMMHIAKSGFYDDVAKSLPPDASTVVLLEGVSDHEHLMKGKLDYNHLAQTLGFASQKESSFTQKAIEGLKETSENRANGKKSSTLEYQVADMDLADFNPATIDFIHAVGKLYESSNFHEFLEQYQALQPSLKRGSATAYADILDKRNKHLFGEIKKSLETHTTIVVPWGARHMPDIQSEIKAWGFVETTHSQYEAVPFKSKALVALVSLLDWLPSESK